MRWLPIVLGVPAAFLLLAVSMACNWVFFSGLGRTPVEAQMLGGVSIASDIFKALCPFWIIAAVAVHRWLSAFGATVMLVLCLVLSFLAAVGFAAGSRGAVTSTREGLNARYEGAGRDLADLTERLRKLAEARPVAVVEQSLNELKQDRRWQSSKQCEDATLTASREFCKGYFQVRGELASAVEAARLTGRIEDLKHEAKELRARGAGEEADPQAGLVSRFVGLSVASVQSGVNLLVAIFLEFGAAFGLYFALTLGGLREGQAQKERPAVAGHPGRDQKGIAVVRSAGKEASGARPRKVRLAHMRG
jgi:hypothetical protein